MNIFTPTFETREGTPAHILAHIEQYGEFEDFVSRSMAVINDPIDVARAVSVLEHVSTDITDCNVSVVNSSSAAEVFSDFGLPNVFETAAAAVAHDAEQDEYYIVLPTGTLGCVKTLDLILTHEVIHLEQVNRGSLRFDTANGKMHWEGKEFLLAEMQEEHLQRMEALTEQYPEEDPEMLFILSEIEKPWELEAYSRTFTPKQLARLPVYLRERLKN